MEKEFERPRQGGILKLLIANPGSSSRRYALVQDGASLASAHLERKGETYFASMGSSGGAQAVAIPVPIPISEATFMAGPDWFVESLLRSGVLQAASEITGVALRIVAPGTFFQKHVPIDDAYLKELEDAAHLAPLHAGPALKEAEHLQRLFPMAILFGVSDSAFHATLPPAAREYALPWEDAQRWDIHRFGYHGISAQSVLRKLKERGPLPGRIVICHLGSGASVMAIKDGLSVDASMGFTPLEGLVMGTRVGDLDAAAVFHLSRKSGMTPSEAESYLNTRCGLLGLSGTSADMRALLESESNGDARAGLAIEAFVYRVRKCIGAYVVVLGGIDQLVFTAAIGERSPVIRARLCAGLKWMGVDLDPELNAAFTSRNGSIQTQDSRVDITVVMTDEMSEMAEVFGHSIVCPTVR